LNCSKINNRTKKRGEIITHQVS